jgi:predicted NBD/HSP70 family sugar kinase
MIRECGAELSKMGRKPVLIELCNDFCYVLGIDIIEKNLKVAIADFMGEIICSAEEPVKREKGAKAVLEQLINALKNIIIKSKVPSEKIWTVSIGAPGIFDYEEGRSRLTSFLDGWDEIDIRTIVQEALSIETLIENDVNLDVIGESWKGVGKDHEDILYVKLGQGLAARIVLQNKLIRGEHQMAGEIGYMMPGFSGSKVVNYESILRNEAVSQKYSDLGGARKIDTISELYALSNNGDKTARKVMRQLLDQFAVVLLNSTTVLDSQLIILGGEACCFGEEEITSLKQKIEQHFFLTKNIIVSSLKDKACLHGAIKLGLNRVEERIVDIW